MIETRHGQDDVRRVPVYSLYSETREPTAAMLARPRRAGHRPAGRRLADLHLYLHDGELPDRGAKKHGVKAIVCDRPNPIGGIGVEGPMLVPGYESFVGQYQIPMRHGMTIGELARLFNDEFGIGADLEVVPMEGWRREMYFDATGLPWVMPSPNMPTVDTAVVYPGSVLFEGTNVSEGRGTTRPFEIVGAPWVMAERFAEEMNRAGLPGVMFRPVVFEPTFQKHAQHGVRRLPDARDRSTGFSAGRNRGGADGGVSRRAIPNASRGATRPTSTRREKMPIDILAGSSELREQIEAGVSARDIARSWEASVAGFSKTRDRFLLYCLKNHEGTKINPITQLFDYLKCAVDRSFSWQMNSISSSSGMSRCVTLTVHGRV